jgi:hypothetical protein
VLQDLERNPDAFGEAGASSLRTPPDRCLGKDGHTTTMLGIGWAMPFN